MQQKKKTPAAEQKKDETIHETMAGMPDKDPEEAVDAIRISENVIAAVTKKYVLEIDGVVRFASGSIVSGLAEMIGRKSQESSIVVNLDGEAVNIAVNLVLRFGVKVPQVAGAVQDTIRKKVEELTGKHVTGVRVTVHDLQELEEESEEDKEQ
jgi:uncharacterized alkaline shock family protein YloU